MCERQQSSGKFRLHKHLLYNKQLAKIATSSFLGIFIVQMKKADIFNYFQISTMLQNFVLVNFGSKMAVI